MRDGRKPRLLMQSIRDLDFGNECEWGTLCFSRKSLPMYFLEKVLMFERYAGGRAVRTPRTLIPEIRVLGCAVKRYPSPAGASPVPARTSLQPGSYPSGGGGNEAVEAWEKGGAKGSLQIDRP